MGRNNCTEGIHLVIMNRPQGRTLIRDQVSLQHTSDIRVELGIQEGAREESLVKLRLLLAMQPVVGSMEAEEKGFLVSHSLLYSSSVVTKLLDNPPALSPRVLAKEGIQDQVVAVLDKLGGQGGSRISIKQGNNW